MKTLPLAAKPRTATGKGGARRLRAAGEVPAILYGDQTEPSVLALSNHEFSNVLHKSSSEHILVDLAIAGASNQLALVKEVQHEPVSGDVIHVDLLHISPTKRIRVTVPVRVQGIADGVKNFGGILQHSIRELEVEGLPVDLPDFVTIDVTPLVIHSAIHARDISVERVTVVTPGEQTIVSVVPPTVLKEVAPTEAAATEESAAGEPEVIGEKERLERAAEKEKEEGGGKEKSGKDKEEKKEKK